MAESMDLFVARCCVMVKRLSGGGLGSCDWEGLGVQYTIGVQYRLIVEDLTVVQNRVKVQEWR